MQNLKLKKINKIAVKLLLTSLILIGVSRIIMELTLNDNVNSRSGEIIYSICYVVVFASLFVFAASLVTLIVLFAMRQKHHY